MRKVFIHYDNISSFGYIIRRLDASLYLVYLEELNIKMEIESKYIKNLDSFFR